MWRFWYSACKGLKLQWFSRSPYQKDLSVTMTTFRTRVSRTILERENSLLEGLSALTLCGSGSSALLSTLRENGDLFFCLIQCQCSGRGPREYKFLWLFRRYGQSRGAKDILHHRALISSGERLVFIQHFFFFFFFSVRGERFKSLFTYLFTLFWPELKPWFLQCASFLPLNRLYAFHWQSVWKPHFPPGSLQPNWCKLFFLRCLTIICHPMQARRQLPQQTQRHD